MRYRTWNTGCWFTRVFPQSEWISCRKRSIEVKCRVGSGSLSGTSHHSTSLESLGWSRLSNSLHAVLHAQRSDARSRAIKSIRRRTLQGSYTGPDELDDDRCLSRFSVRRRALPRRRQKRNTSSLLRNKQLPPSIGKPSLRCHLDPMKKNAWF